YIGRFTLEEIDGDPDHILGGHIARLRSLDARKFGSHNRVRIYMILLKAAFAKYIKTKRLRVINPWNIIDMPAAGERRTEKWTEENYQDALRRAREPDFPSYLAAYIVSRFEQGLRAGEVFSWRWETTQLSPTDGSLPWLK